MIELLHNKKNSLWIILLLLLISNAFALTYVDDCDDFSTPDTEYMLVNVELSCSDVSPNILYLVNSSFSGGNIGKAYITGVGLNSSYGEFSYLDSSADIVVVYNFTGNLSLIDTLYGGEYLMIYDSNVNFVNTPTHVGAISYNSNVSGYVNGYNGKQLLFSYDVLKVRVKNKGMPVDAFIKVALKDNFNKYKFYSSGYAVSGYYETYLPSVIGNDTVGEYELNVSYGGIEQSKIVSFHSPIDEEFNFDITTTTTPTTTTTLGGGGIGGLVSAYSGLLGLIMIISLIGTTMFVIRAYFENKDLTINKILYITITIAIALAVISWLYTYIFG